MLTRELPFDPAPPEARRARSLAAAMLRAASRALARLAARMALVEAAPEAEPVLEFHGEAGAPEGALYVNGRLVGHVLGVNRL